MKDRYRKKRERDMEFFYRGKATPPVAKHEKENDRPQYEEVGKGQCAYCGIKGVRLVACKATSSTSGDEGVSYGFFTFSIGRAISREKVCRMCHDMTEGISNNAHFKAAQEEWEKYQRKVKRILGEVRD